MSQKSQDCEQKDGLQEQSEPQSLEGVQSPGAEEGAAAMASTAPSSSSAECSLIPGPQGEGTPLGAESTPQSPQGASSSPQGAMSAEGTSSQEGAGASAPSAKSKTGRKHRSKLDKTVWHLVNFLLIKYRYEELTTKEEILALVVRKYERHYPKIFQKALEIMQMVFGVEVREVNPTSHTFVLLPFLGLTYDKKAESYAHTLPKNGLLITVLSTIFLEGGRASEQKIWESLKEMDVRAGQEHFIYGEPRKLLNQEWVKNGYLEIRRVPHSQPPCYEYLWGQRAHMETSEFKILEHLTKITGTALSCFPSQYLQALKEGRHRGPVPEEVGALSRSLGSIHPGPYLPFPKP
ncbi:PREDICTED: melanoma-associated antigen 10-like [Elephantulus edwardii]|uniref:melanoma-associated antigen 10-like n=1 Tax=Elephantulus edwardii TaxID=28737 RepID=UPI0003F09BC7|nr:PREDICTED: melanoma-associated antigen 10-like [Elephantulus edwardii]